MVVKCGKLRVKILTNVKSAPSWRFVWFSEGQSIRMLVF